MGRLFCRAAFLFLLLMTALLPPVARAQQNPPANRPEGRFNVLRELDNAMENLSELVGPSVVQIQVSAYGPREEDSGAQEFVFLHAVGSGIIVDADGYIMTNITWLPAHNACA
jgi:S1-C subfamily serine protease